MKKCVIFTVMLVMMIGMYGVIGTFASDDGEESETVKKPTLSRTEVTIKPGKTIKLKVQDNSGPVVWSSKHPEIATVSSKGKVTALSEGVVKILADVDGVRLSCKVRVEAVKTVKIIAVGDNLIHQDMINEGFRADGSCNYDSFYSNIKKYLDEVDVGIINQEVIVSDDSSLWAGYPEFASPLELGEAVVNAGFNVITCATNHTLDKGIDGALAAAAYWKSKKTDGVLMTGLYSSQKTYDRLSIGEYNGIKIAFLNYTYGLNGNKPCSDNSFLVKRLDEELIKREIEKARTKADVVIVLPHWGIEYQFEPSDQQRELAQNMADWGADIIIGTHPHVLQPLEMLTAADGRTVPCYYSLGNLVSNYLTVKQQLEGMAHITIKKWNGKVTIKYANLIPLVNYVELNPQSNSDCTHTVYKLIDIDDNLMKRHYLYSDSFNKETLWKQYHDIMGK